MKTDGKKARQNNRIQVLMQTLNYINMGNEIPESIGSKRLTPGSIDGSQHFYAGGSVQNPAAQIFDLPLHRDSQMNKITP